MKIVVAFGFGLMLASSVLALGATGCACLPPELAARGLALEQSFAATPVDELSRQAWAGALCANHPCEDEVTEEQAKALLGDYFDRQQRAEDRWFTWLGTGIAAVSAVISLFALWQTHVASSEARAASDRSIRNEERIEQLSEES